MLFRSLPAFTGMVATMEFNRNRLEMLAPAGFSLATDVAEWLVRQHVPFREAHEIAGKCVSLAESRNCELWDLTEAELQSVSAHLTSGVRDVLSTEGSLNARSAFGGTAPMRVREQLQSLRQHLQR